jgi:hypothetical protein
MCGSRLRRYISEIATAIGDLKLKAADVWPTVQVVSRLHCTYAEFAPALVLQLKKVFEPAFCDAYPERRERLSRRRSTLRLLYEPDCKPSHFSCPHVDSSALSLNLNSLVSQV